MKEQPDFPRVLSHSRFTANGTEMVPPRHPAIAIEVRGRDCSFVAGGKLKFKDTVIRSPSYSYDFFLSFICRTFCWHFFSIAVLSSEVVKEQEDDQKRSRRSSRGQNRNNNLQ